MHRGYEAIYRKGELEWVDGMPSIPDGERVVVMVDRPGTATEREKEFEKIWDAARGAWGLGKSVEEVDRDTQHD